MIIQLFNLCFDGYELSMKGPGLQKCLKFMACFPKRTACLRFSQAREVFVSHAPDPFVDVIKVDQQELSMPLQLLFMSLGLGLMQEIKT